MKVQFWFDPACPFCWMTSRWLVRVAKHRDLSIEWLPISLLRKNGTREGEPFFAEVTASHGMLRVVEASLRLWDGFLAMVATDGFYELKRTRAEAPERVAPADLQG